MTGLFASQWGDAALHLHVRLDMGGLVGWQCGPLAFVCERVVVSELGGDAGGPLAFACKRLVVAGLGGDMAISHLDAVRVAIY